jgi:NADH-quinone oxidoreductase subunit J
MLLGVDRKESLAETLPFQRPIAVALGLVIFAEVLLLAGHTWATGAKTASGVPIEGGGELGNNIQRVARVLFTDFLWPFQLTAILLVIAVVGSVALAKRSGEAPSPESDDVGSEETRTSP